MADKNFRNLETVADRGKTVTSAWQQEVWDPVEEELLRAPLTAFPGASGIDIVEHPGGTADAWSAIDAALTAHGKAVLKPGLTYYVSQPVIVEDAEILDLNGATLAARDGFSTSTGDAVVVVKEGDGTLPAWNVKIHGGKIDARWLATSCVDVVHGRAGHCFELLTVRGTKHGVLVGSDLDYASTDFHCTRVDVWWHEEYSPVSGREVNPSDSIGIYYKYHPTPSDTDKFGASDSYVSGCMAVGYRTGFQIDGGSIDLLRCHAWNRRAHGPLTCCFRTGTRSTATIVTSCYADTPHNWKWDTGTEAYVQDGAITDVYGYEFGASNMFAVGNRVFNNANTDWGGTNGLITPVRIVNGSGAFGWLLGMRVEGGNSSFRFKNDLTGSLTGSTLMGWSDGGLYSGTVSVVERIQRSVQFGGTLSLNRLSTMTSVSAANLASAAHAVNTTNKGFGTAVQITDQNYKIARTFGGTATSPWYDLTGTLITTPS